MREPVPMPELGDLPAEEFRARLHEAADWIADYRGQIADRAILSAVEPGQIAAAFPPSLPDAGEPLERLLDEFDRLIVPGVVHWGHPAFLGYFGSTTTAPGIIGEMLAAALNVSAMLWQTSPAASELEGLVLAWIRQMINLGDGFRGIVYDTASVATFHALAAAREASGLAVRREGLAGRPDVAPMIVYASEQAHSSVEKAAIALGLGEANVRRIAIDAEFRMDARALRDAIAADKGKGNRPLAVVATVGTTSTTSVDPVRAIAAICREHDCWLHVDAAYGGAMGCLPEGRWAMDGVDEADSVVVNPHKWLFVPLDFSALYTRRADLLRAVFALTPEYLRGDADRGVENYMDYGIQLGRRFRALKAWMVLRAFGREGVRARIREHRRLASLFASWVDGDPHFERLAPVPMGVVCFRASTDSQSRADGADAKSDDFNRALVEAINRTGRAYLTHTEVGGRLALRVAVGNVLTTERDLEGVWALVRDLAARLRAGDGGA